MMYNTNYKQDIRKEFIANAFHEREFCREFKLKKRFISWLFRHYFVWEFVIDWYDETEKPIRDENGKRTENYRTIEWDERISWCNWQDLYVEGAWGMTQKTVDRYARVLMNGFRKAGHLDGRCWISVIPHKDGDMLQIYLYGRDIHEFDYHFIFKKHKTKTRHECEMEFYKNRPCPCPFCEDDDDCQYDHSPDKCCDLCWYVYGKERVCENCNGGWGSV